MQPCRPPTPAFAFAMQCVVISHGEGWVYASPLQPGASLLTRQRPGSGLRSLLAALKGWRLRFACQAAFFFERMRRACSAYILTAANPLGSAVRPDPMSVTAWGLRSQRLAITHMGMPLSRKSWMSCCHVMFMRRSCTASRIASSVLRMPFVGLTAAGEVCATSCGGKKSDERRNKVIDAWLRCTVD